jgi:hypothetical protein
LCTTDLRDQINTKYKQLPDTFQGAITYAWVLLYCLFAASRDTTAALIKFLAIWCTKGLQRIKGENIVTAKHEVLAACRRLYASGNLPNEATIDVLKGLENCSVQAFRDIFALYWQDATKVSLDLISVCPFGFDNCMDKINMFMNKAVDFYHSLCTSNQWNIPKGHKFSAAVTQGKCWNYKQDGCHTSTCPKPRDEGKYKKNHEEFCK